MRDARRNRWFLLYALAFAGLSLTLAWMTLSGVGNSGLAGYGLTSASLINLVLLIVPLMGLTLGALSLSGERDSGTLLYLMAQPINQLELLLGNFIGLALALLAAIGVGFGLTAAIIAFNAGGADVGAYAGLLLLACLLALTTLSIGYLISTIAQRGATAVGVALFLWLLLVFFGDLGLMGSALVMRLDVGQLFGLSLLNPLQLFKLAAILNLRSNLEVLGPVGVFAFRTYGLQLMPLLVGLLVIWVIAPFVAATQIFRRKGIL